MTPAQAHVSEEFLKVRPALKKLAISLTRNLDRAEDLLQDAYLRLLDKANLYQPDTTFVAWAIIVTRNCYISQRRLLKNQPHYGLGEVNLPPREAVQDARICLREAIRAIRAVQPPRHRAILLLVGLEGARYDAVAKRMGVAEGTVKSGLSRARSFLRERQ